jgi:isoquinoline 1-oxidoreductase alpha subunit
LNGEDRIVIKLTVNGRDSSLDIEPEMPLLWAIREQLGLTGTKFGCGIAQCGSCTVLLDGQPTRSCSFPVSAAQGHKITTIEGLSADSGHRVQMAWKELDVPQCGYCQSGQILAAAALLESKPKPTDADVDEAMTNICRCGTYGRIRAAIHWAAGSPNSRGSVIHMAGLQPCQGDACEGNAA